MYAIRSYYAPDQSPRHGRSATRASRGRRDGAGSIFVNNVETDITVRYALPADISPLEYLMTLKIPTPSGASVPFSAVCSVANEEGIGAVKRVDGKREVSLSAEIGNKRAVPAINDDIEAWYRDEFAPSHPGTVLVTGGEFSEFADLLIQILRVFLLGLFLIYAILGAQFVITSYSIHYTKLYER